MRRSALPLLFLVACASAEATGEHFDRNRAPFTSAQATLLDFELDGELVSDTNDWQAVRSQIEAQLFFTVGQLNGERSVGRLGQLEVSGISITLNDPPPIPIPPPLEPPKPPADAGIEDGGADTGAPGGPADAGALDSGAADAGEPVDAGPPPPPPPPPPPSWTVHYHARLPVAWGRVTKPTSYMFTLPKRLSQEAQVSFASKYGNTCIDPTLGSGDVGHMFIVYRPQQWGCDLASDDVVSIDARVTESKENSRGKYPEYHRLWADNVLRIVAIFSRELPTPAAEDVGVSAYNHFLYNTQIYLQSLQPDAAKRTPIAPYAESGVTKTKVAAELPDGRTVRIDIALVGTVLGDEGPELDGWYDMLTPTADVVLYNGHAGLGSNVRSLMGKGAFNPGQYLIWFANGCDTFAYVDRTLIDRRARVNADDPNGTKYMDTVTNVLAGYFGELEATAMTFLKALVEVRDPNQAPKTYEQIFSSVDQMVVISGEEDNVLEPMPPAPPPIVGQNPDLVDPPPPEAPPGTYSFVDAPREPAKPEPPPVNEEKKPQGCTINAAGTTADAASGIAAALTAALGALFRRRRPKR